MCIRDRQDGQRPLSGDGALRRRAHRRLKSPGARQKRAARHISFGQIGYRNPSAVMPRFRPVLALAAVALLWSLAPARAQDDTETATASATSTATASATRTATASATRTATATVT